MLFSLKSKVLLETERSGTQNKWKRLW